LHVGDQMRRLIIAALAQMRFIARHRPSSPVIARPSRRTLLAAARLGVMGS
jgi:hypothetical protein